MTINEAINKIDSLKPNSYSPVEKVEWLSTLDGMIFNEIIKLHSEDDCDDFVPYKEFDLEKELLVKHPYDTIYIHWLEAQINYWNQDIALYENAMAMFNNSYEGFERHYIRTTKPHKADLKYF